MAISRLLKNINGEIKPHLTALLKGEMALISTSKQLAKVNLDDDNSLRQRQRADDMTAAVKVFTSFVDQCIVVD